MSHFYYLWIEQLQTRDLAIEQLSIMALSVVVGWELVYMLPERIRPTVHRLYILAGIALYTLTILQALRG